MRLALRPGLDEAGLATVRQALGTFPDELSTLLAWHDGQADDFRGTFADCWCLLPGQDIVALARDLDKDPPPGWVCGWIPFARDSGDSYLVLDPAAEGKPVRALWSGKNTAKLVAPSLTAWFATLVTDFEAGRYVEDPERGDFIRSSHDGAMPTDETDETEEASDAN
jgi:cell wall assembly regulator SMI1